MIPQGINFSVRALPPLSTSAAASFVLRMILKIESPIILKFYELLPTYVYKYKLTHMCVHASLSVFLLVDKNNIANLPLKLVGFHEDGKQLKRTNAIEMIKKLFSSHGSSFYFSFVLALLFSGYENKSPWRRGRDGSNTRIWNNKRNSLENKKINIKWKKLHRFEVMPRQFRVK